MLLGKRLAELEKRLADLERRMDGHEVNDVACRNFEVYEEQEQPAYTIYYKQPKSQRISVKDVVRKILDHLGMRLVYVEGKPTTVDMQKTKVAR